MIQQQTPTPAPDLSATLTGPGTVRIQVGPTAHHVRKPTDGEAMRGAMQFVVFLAQMDGAPLHVRVGSVDGEQGAVLVHPNGAVETVNQPGRRAR